ncbi:MAG: 2-phospho-L-lactate guanylyltransferase [Gordonia sp. (in: high G+C Gram-positive bacteria)]|uniref:2-phospho-L-lactate guanylyltransferase n=1 Tax=Gordonia sp. (in: high G+C Gram-positive bacteria) TaxID=84139 RepID=UPI0039E55ED8
MSDEVTVVLALKELHRAKSRLAPRFPSSDARAALVEAMFADTVRAVQAAGAHRIVVVSPDPLVRRRAEALARPRRPVLALDERPDTRGLNAAFRLGAAAAPPDHRIVYLQADLPALTPDSFADAVHRAGRHRAAFVADRHGTGTALLSTSSSRGFAPAFGPDSAAAHRAAGAVELDPAGHRWPDLQCDVDTPDDLREAVALGSGPETAVRAAART